MKIDIGQIYRLRNKLLLYLIIIILLQLFSSITDESFFSFAKYPFVMIYLLYIPKYWNLKKSYILNGSYKRLEKYQTENNSYRSDKNIVKVKGIVLHCPGEKTTYLKRYIDFQNELGYNAERNHWNKPTVLKMAHSFIGHDKNNEVIVVNTIPYSKSCFVCGKGENGSFDLAPNEHIQIQVCEDAENNNEYFEDAVLGATVQYCAYLCKTYSIKAETIVSDKEAFNLGYAKEYSYFEDWLNLNGYKMNDFRDMVNSRLKIKEYKKR